MKLKCAETHMAVQPGPGRLTRLGLCLASSLGSCLASCLALPAGAQAEPPRRVVSINLCTDQLLLALAEPTQIAGLSRFSRHAEMSFMAGRAAAFPSLRGSAEEVLARKPDLVLAGAFSGRATRVFLTEQGVHVETFVPPRTLAEAKAEIERMAALLGAKPRGDALTADIDAALAAAAATSKGRPALSALAIQRRGFASGRETLLSAAIEAAGISNAASVIGIGSIARAPIEVIVKLHPDVLIVEEIARVADQATALLHHPALAHAYPPSRLIRLPVAEVTCGGPALAPLIRRMAQWRAKLD